MQNLNKRKLARVALYNRVLELLRTPMSQGEVAEKDGMNKRREYYWWALNDLHNEGFVKVVARGNMNCKIYQAVRFNYGAGMDFTVQKSKDQSNKEKAEKNRLARLAKDKEEGIVRLTDSKHWTPRAKVSRDSWIGSTFSTMSY